MRYAITGATGFVGGALARQLRDAGHEVAALVLREHPADIPFGLLYLLDPEGKRALLAGAAGIEPGTEASPAEIDLGAEKPFWPVADVIETGTAQVLEDFPAAPEGVRRIAVLPIQQPGDGRPTGVLVACAFT